MNKTLNKR